MLFQTYARQAQGFGLPNESQTDKVQDAGTLSKWRQCWRIKHPQAMTTQRDNLNLFLHHWLTAGDLSLFGGMGREPKKTPPLCLSFVWHCFAATRSAFVLLTQRIIPMIYTFLITANRGRIADIQRIRTISVSAANEQTARCALSGLSLVFLSRSPAGRMPA